MTRCKRRRVTHPRWSLGRARLLTPRRRINDESPMGEPVAGRTNGTQPNDFSLFSLSASTGIPTARVRPATRINGNTPRHAAYALIKRNVRLLYTSLSRRRESLCSIAFGILSDSRCKIFLLKKKKKILEQEVLESCRKKLEVY